MKQILTLACLLFLALPAVAGPDAAVRQAFNNRQHEITRCVAFFDQASHCLANSNDPKTAASYKQAGDAMLKYAFVFGQEAGMTVDAMGARVQLEKRYMLKKIAGRCENISSILLPHLDSCAALLQDPTRGMK